MTIFSTHLSELQQVITKGRKEIKQAQEKLNSSLTTPLADAEVRVLEKGTWLSEVTTIFQMVELRQPLA